MIRFHKNGVTLIEDAQGSLHLLDPKETLRDLAKYVWHEETLKQYRIGSEDPWPGGKREVKVVQLVPEKAQRLRSLTEVQEDPYFAGGADLA